MLKIYSDWTYYAFPGGPHPLNQASIELITVTMIDDAHKTSQYYTVFEKSTICGLTK
jgi:hypothetical protein